MGTERIDAAGTGSATGSGTAPGSSPVPGSSTGAPAASGGFSFHDLLEDLNPLQYIPVVGSIYRAVTGDEGNGTLRFVASLGTSFALGGPLGLGITVGEKVLGIDPEQIARHWLNHLLHPNATVTVTESGGSTTTAAQTPAQPPTRTGTPTAARGWSPQELAAYGIRGGQDGTLSGPAGATGADLLNTLELGRLRAHPA